MELTSMQPNRVQPIRRRTAKRARRARFLRLVSILLLALAMLVLAPHVVKLMARSEAPAVLTYKVQPGETLWEIASVHSQGRDVRNVISAIKRANQMESAIIQPGQELVIPEFSR
jgi:LysM repeat protein